MPQKTQNCLPVSRCCFAVLHGRSIKMNQESAEFSLRRLHYERSMSESLDSEIFYLIRRLSGEWMASFLYETRLQRIMVVVVIILDWDVSFDKYSYNPTQAHLIEGLAILQTSI